MNTIVSIPQPALDVIERYKHLNIGDNRAVRCPYYRNPRSGKERWGLNAFSGKGSPQEIEDELKIIERLEHKNFSSMEEDEVRDIMRKRRLGVECSGFIAHIFDAWTRQSKSKRVYEVLQFPQSGLFAKIAIYLRPFTHIGVATLTDLQNARELKNWQELQPGDLIRFVAEVDHAILVIKTERDNNDKLISVEYAQSVREETGEGIKEGKITITNESLPLVEQHWEEWPNTSRTINQQRGFISGQEVACGLYRPLYL
ncbi:MAG: hypothetical protein HYV65_00225 [Candidatus Spechtbacteria bacterium]|nr:hypothetical protein [Candidatus Spechtbacteria bacterium]